MSTMDELGNITFPEGSNGRVISDSMSIDGKEIFNTAEGSWDLYCEASSENFQQLVTEVEKLRKQVEDQKSFQECLKYYTKLAFDNVEKIPDNSEWIAGHLKSVTYEGDQVSFWMEKNDRSRSCLTLYIKDFIEWANSLESK